MDEGRLDEAVALFGQLIEREPGNPAFHYMQGLAHKYRFDWPASLASLLDDWVAAGPGRRVENVFVADAEPASPEAGIAWWADGDEDEDGE